jgi:hypothetical protein
MAARYLNTKKIRNAELYDPPSGAFAQVSVMTTVREWFTLALLNDGTVLLLERDIANNQVEASAEIYN